MTAGLTTISHGQDTLVHERLLRNDPRSILGQQELAGRDVVITGLADMSPRDMREASGHVRVITNRRMEASGARDLLDVLHLVPELSFGHVGNGLAAGAIHGNWGGPGRILFLLNGAPLNEHDQGLYVIGQRIPLVHVERIEVLTGPASMRYGGYAALGVVNIVTWTSDHGTGARAELRTGYNGAGTTRTTASASGAHRLGRDQDISYVFAHGRGTRSMRDLQLPDGRVIAGPDSTAYRASTVGFQYRWKGLRTYLNFMEENSGPQHTGAFQLVRDVQVGLEHHVPITDKLELVWGIGHVEQAPTTVARGPVATTSPLQFQHTRTTANAMVGYGPFKWLGVWAGAQAWVHQARLTPATPDTIRSHLSGTRLAQINDVAWIGELRLRGRAGSLTAGYRLEDHTLTVPVAAPMVAYVKTLRNFHGKLHWSEGFRQPTVWEAENTMADRAWAPERTRMAGAELGYRMAGGFNVVLSAHHTTIQLPGKPVDPELPETTRACGTQGVSLRTGLATARWNAMIAVSMATPISGAQALGTPSPTQEGGIYPTLPLGSGAAMVDWAATGWLSLRARCQWRSATWSRIAADMAEGPIRMHHTDELVLFSGLTLRPGKGLVIFELGCDDLLDTGRLLAVPDGLATHPYGMNGRTFTLALIHRFVR